MITDVTVEKAKGSAQGPTDKSFGKEELVALAKLIGSEIDTIAPVGDKPAFLVAQLGAIIRDYLRSKGGRPQLSLHTNGSVYVSRASNLALEIVDGLSCFYLIFPGAIDGANTSAIERATLAHYLSLKKDLTPEWTCYFLPVLRQPMSETKYDSSLRLFGTGQLLYCGDYICGDERDPNYRLYISGARVETANATQPLLGI